MEHPAARAIVGVLWERFRDAREWPVRRDVILRLDELGIAFDPDREKASGTFLVGDGSEARISASFDALLDVSEVRDLLEPLPALLRNGAARFVSTPGFHDITEGRPFLSWSDIRSLWRTDDQAVLACALIGFAHVPLYFNGVLATPHTYRLQCGIETLRYEHVQNLSDVLAVRGRQAERYKSADVESLVTRIFGDAVQTRDWPRAVVAAVRHRDVGFVPHLINGAAAPFFWGEFGYGSRDRLKLNVRAFEIVDPTSEKRRLAVDAIRELARVWRERGDQLVTTADLAVRVGVSPDVLQPVMLLLSTEPWGRSTTGDDATLWGMWIREEVWRLRSVKNWSEYDALRGQLWSGDIVVRTSTDEPYEEPARFVIGSTDASAEPQNERLDRELEMALGRFAPHLAMSYRQVINDLGDHSRESFVGSVSEMRASLEIAVRELSKDVKQGSRRERIAAIMQEKGRSTGEALAADEVLADRFGKLGAWLYGEASGAAHGRSPTRTEATTLLAYWTALMRSLVL
jgi:hypothetical protein